MVNILCYQKLERVHFLGCESVRTGCGRLGFDATEPQFTLWMILRFWCLLQQVETACDYYSGNSVKDGFQGTEWSHGNPPEECHSPKEKQWE